MYDFLGNNEIDDLMKKYDAIDKAVNSVEPSDYYTNNEAPTLEKPASEASETPDNEVKEADNAPEDYFKETDNTSVDDFKEVSDTEDDEFKEVYDASDYYKITDEAASEDSSDDEFKEVVDGHLMLDPTIPSYIPEINLNGTGDLFLQAAAERVYIR